MRAVRTRQATAALAVGIALALSLAGCGGGGKGATAGATGSSGGTKDLGSATVVLGGKVITWAPAYVAVCQGFFKNHGLDVSLTVSEHGTTAAIAALVSGDATSAMTGAPAAVAPIRQGAPVQLLFNASQGYGVQVAASTQWMKDHHITKSSSLADRVKALKGARVGILNPGDSIDQLYKYVLPKYGLDPNKDITETAFGGYPPQLAAMKIGSLDVIAGSPPWAATAESQGIGQTLFSGTEIPGLNKYPYLVGDANTNDIKNNPDKVKALVAGMADAMSYLRKNPNGGKGCLRKEFPDLDQKTFDSAYDFAMTTVPKSPLITKDVYKALSDFADASKQPLGVSYDDAVAIDIAKQATG